MNIGEGVAASIFFICVLIFLIRTELFQYLNGPTVNPVNFTCEEYFKNDK